MHHANLEKLKSLRLFGMVRALQELTGLDDRGRLDFDDQLAHVESAAMAGPSGHVDSGVVNLKPRLQRP